MDGKVFAPGDDCLVVWADGSIYAGVVEKRYDPQEDVVIVRRRDKTTQTIASHTDHSWKARLTIDSPEGIEHGEMLWYRVHYKGWKRQYDDWVPQRRMLIDSPENHELRKTVNEKKQAAKPGTGSAPGASQPPPKKAKTRQTEPAEPRPGSKETAEVRVAVPMALKRILIDDWEYVTKDHRIINLPRPYTVEDVLAEYKAFCAPRYVVEGAKENMASFIDGLLTYFDRTLGMMLLYRFERQQYFEFRQQKKPNPDDFRPCELYGAEHLSRLLISMPALLAQAQMDDKTLDYLVGELSELGRFLASNPKFFGGSDAYDVGTRLYEEYAN